MSYYEPQRVTDQRGNAWHVLIAWVFAVLTLGYFLPWAVAASRHKSNTLAIALVNLVLGWTFIGWVVALVMACMSHQMAVVSPPGYLSPPPPQGYLPPGQPQGYLPPAPPPQALEMPNPDNQPHFQATSERYEFPEPRR